MYTPPVAAASRHVDAVTRSVNRSIAGWGVTVQNNNNNGNNVNNVSQQPNQTVNAVVGLANKTTLISLNTNNA